jgi:uncharacterized membrane protein YfcA
MLGVILIRPKRWLEGRSESVDHRFTWLQLLIFFAIGVYGGFIQAGVGIFLLAGLVLSAGYDLVRGNAVKVLIVLCFTAAALVVFVINGQVVWAIGLILGVGNMLGAWVAARMAVERGATFVRWVLIAVVAVSGAKLLGVFDLIGRLFQN